MSKSLRRVHFVEIEEKTETQYGARNRVEGTLCLRLERKMLKKSNRRLSATSSFFIALSFCFACLGILPDGGCQAAASAFYAKVVRVIDGDTLEIQQKMAIQRVRIWGVDTPEWDQPYGEQSSRFTRSRLLGKEVQVIPKDVDTYGRLVAMITMDDINIGEALIQSGLAWVHIYYCNQPICDDWKRLQKRAASEHRGLWVDSHPVAPWQWKKKHRHSFETR